MAGRCNCVNATYTGCQCGWQDSATTDVQGSGSAADPFYLDVIVDTDADNNLEARSSGLYVPGPRGLLAFETITTNQTGINPLAPIAGLAVSATLDANRAIRVVWTSSGMASSGASDVWAFEIREGASAIATRFEQTGVTTGVPFGGGDTTALLDAPTAGVHTFFAQLSRATGAGVGEHSCSPAWPSWIAVYDDGPAV